MCDSFIISNRFESATLTPVDVHFINQDCKKIFVHYDTGSIWEHSTMEEILDRIGSRDIIRCHHSLAVNLNHIKSFNNGKSLLLDSGDVLFMCRAAWLRTKRAWEDKFYRDIY